jgi:hypothetical protein
LLAVLLISTDGCATRLIIQRADGYTQQPVKPLKGDEAFQHGGVTYVISKHNEGETNVLVLPYTIPEPYMAYKPNPAYYGLMPLTIATDIVTSPFQLGIYLLFKYGQPNM